MEYQCLMYPTMPTLLSHHFLALSSLVLLTYVNKLLTYTPSPAPTGLSTLYDCIHLITHALVVISHSQLDCEPEAMYCYLVLCTPPNSAD